LSGFTEARFFCGIRLEEKQVKPLLFYSQTTRSIVQDVVSLRQTIDEKPVPIFDPWSRGYQVETGWK
jgi:hypothetical protein